MEDEAFELDAKHVGQLADKLLVSRVYDSPLMLVVMKSALLEVSGEARLQCLAAVTRDLEIQHEKGLVRDRDRTLSLNVNLRLLNATVNITDQAGLKQHFHVLLSLLCLESPHVAPFIFSPDVRQHHLLILLWHVHASQLFMQLIEQVAKEIASILLLIIWVVLS